MSESTTPIRRENALLDIVKFIAAILICASHCLPIFGNAALDYYYGQWFFRFCVPFFLISSGFFFSRMEPKKQLRYLTRIAIIYVFSILLYLPYILKDGAGLVRNFLFGYVHLWYLPALLLACGLRMLTAKFMKRKFVFICAAFLFAFGIFFDEYYKLFSSPALNKVASFIDADLGQTRNGIFFAFPMICLGEWLGNRELLKNDSSKKEKIPPLLAVLIVAFALSYLESRYFRETLPGYVSITLDLSVFNWLPALVLFVICMSVEIKLPAFFSRSLRKGADVVYIVHFLIITVLGERCGIWGMRAFHISALISIVIAALYVAVRSLLSKPSKKDI